MCKKYPLLDSEKSALRMFRNLIKLEIVKKIQFFHFISSHMKKSIWKIEKNASENGVQLWVTWV